MTSLINKWHLIAAFKIDLLVIKLTRISQNLIQLLSSLPMTLGILTQSCRGCTLGILTHPGDLYNLGEGVTWVYSHILETSTILERVYPGYTHTSWRPVQSWRGCTLGILTHPEGLYNLEEHVTWVYSHILEISTVLERMYPRYTQHILETSTILERVYPGYTHTSWRPLQFWTGCILGIRTHPGDLYSLGQVVSWVYVHILATSTISERV